MFCLNKVFICGNLGEDPLLRYTQAGVPVCTLRVATTDAFVDESGEPGVCTQWHSVVVVGEGAKRCATTLYKGALVTLEGRLKTRTYTGKDEVVRERTEVVCAWVALPNGVRGRKKERAGREVPDDVRAFMTGLMATG